MDLWESLKESFCSAGGSSRLRSTEPSDDIANRLRRKSHNDFYACGSTIFK